MFSLNFSSKAPWCSPVSCRKELQQVSFLCIFRTTTVPHIFGAARCYKVTLVKKYNKPLLQKSETKIFKQKRFHKKLVQSQREKKLRRFEIKSNNVWIANNKHMFAVKLLANSVVAGSCYIDLNMTEHISHFAYHLRLYIIIDPCWKLLTF